MAGGIRKGKRRVVAGLEKDFVNGQIKQYVQKLTSPLDRG